MHLDPRRPDLCVLQATIPDLSGTGTHLIALSAPAAPFGHASWQLALTAGYLDTLRRANDSASVQSFHRFLTERACAPIPAPTEPYRFSPWHDPHVTCLLDLAFRPGGTPGLPRASLVVMEQESGCAQGGDYIRVRRCMGTLPILTMALQEITGERDRLSAKACGRNAPALAPVRDLADKAADRVAAITRAARSAHTLARAAAVRDQLQLR